MIDGCLQSMGFTKSEADPNLYYIFVVTDLLVLVLYVNDLLLTYIEKFITECKVHMAAKFEIKDIGMMHYFLGLGV
jgi:hypothetical protein